MPGEKTRFLAIDLGAESGRGVLGELGGDRLSLKEVHRFSNVPVRVLDSLHWDALRIHHEIKTTIATACRTGRVLGMGIDSWGVDFGLLTKTGDLVGNPHHYRDSRTDGMLEEAFKLVSQDRIFACTGIQFMQLNTLYQLLAMVRARSPLLDAADSLLMMGELFTYLLTGERIAEFTNATTSQVYDPTSGNWAYPLMADLGIPRRLFPEIVQPGTAVAPLRRDIANETGANNLTVYVPAVHDTASAIVAVPLADAHACYISSGTWSLMGAEIEEPIINEGSLAANMTNEGGAGGKFCFLKNIMGMWLLQECRRTWEQEGEELDYPALQALAEKASPLRTLLDPDHADFFHPGDMPRRILNYARRTKQPVPSDKGAIVRCVLESLALKYRQVLTLLEELTGRHISTVHIVGGGSQNSLLNQFTADATGRPVVAGPVEATAIGNILVQAVAAGVIDSIGEGRALVRRSFSSVVFHPRDAAAWGEAYDRFLALQESDD